MSRDLTPAQALALEQHCIQKGLPSFFDSMRSMTVTYNGVTEKAYADEYIALCEQYPYLGKLFAPFHALHNALSKVEGGLDLLQKKDAELSAYVTSGTGDRDSYLIKWFEGRLDPGFYYREYNNELFLSSIMEEAKSLHKSSLDAVIQSAAVRVESNSEVEYSFETTLCTVTFRRTAGVADGHEIEVKLELSSNAIPKKGQDLLLDADDRVKAYDKAAELIGEDALSDYVICNAELTFVPENTFKKCTEPER